MSGKFNSRRDEVVYRATLDGTCETYGSVDILGWHASKLIDFYGYDYIILEDAQGFVSVEKFEHIGDGYYCPVERTWNVLVASAADLNDGGDW